MGQLLFLFLGGRKLSTDFGECPKTKNSAEKNLLMRTYVCVVGIYLDVSSEGISQYLESRFEQIGDVFFNIGHVGALSAKHSCQSPYEFIISLLSV